MNREQMEATLSLHGWHLAVFRRGSMITSVYAVREGYPLVSVLYGSTAAGLGPLEGSTYRSWRDPRYAAEWSAIDKEQLTAIYQRTMREGWL